MSSVTLQTTDIHFRGIHGEEIQDEGFNLNNARRRSNSSSYAAGLKDFKTKFEQVEHEIVFEESVHGADDNYLSRVDTESSASTTSGSDEVKKMA